MIQGFYKSLPWMLRDFTNFALSNKHPNKNSCRFTRKNIFPPLSNAFEPTQWTTNLNDSSNWNRLRQQSSVSGFRASPFFSVSTFPPIQGDIFRAKNSVGLSCSTILRRGPLAVAKRMVWQQEGAFFLETTFVFFFFGRWWFEMLIHFKHKLFLYCKIRDMIQFD